MMSPVFSIIVPVYNVEKYIARCLDSLFNQEFEEGKYEVIIVNDGTPDFSMSIVETYAKCHKNIVIINKDNGGVSSARNAGIHIAKGKYLLFVDSDDVIEMNVLSAVYSELIKNIVEILVLNSYEFRNGSSDKVELYSFPKNLTGKTISGVELFRKGFLGRGSVCGAAFKRQFVLQHQIVFPESVINGEDTLFMAVCFALSSKVKHMNLFFYKIYLNIGSASQSWDYERVRALSHNFFAIRNYIEKYEFTIDQMDIFNYHVYLIVSNIINQFFSVHRLDKYFVVKRVVVESGFYPIKINILRQRKGKIHLLNASFDLYCLPIFFRQLIKDIFKNNI